MIWLSVFSLLYGRRHYYTFSEKVYYISGSKHGEKKSIAPYVQWKGSMDGKCSEQYLIIFGSVLRLTTAQTCYCEHARNTAAAHIILTWNHPSRSTGGAGEGGGLLKWAASATAITSQHFECWAESWLAADTKITNQLHHVNNDIIMFHDRTLDLYF